MKTNQIIVTGNLGGDPELHKRDENSQGVVSFRLAESISRMNEKTKTYEQSHTNWFPVRAFGSLGSRVKSGVKKGDRVTVLGKLKTYQYETPDGRMVSAFEIMADDVLPSRILPKAPDSSPDFSEVE
jgi:single-strand DNA-binding protein